MAITELPTRTEESIGQEKQDRATPLGQRPYDPRYGLDATRINRILDLLVALGESVGLDDGSTAGSLREAVAELEADVASTGRVLWSQDRDTALITDQFDAAPLTLTAGSVVASLQAKDWGGSAIRLAATGLTGNYILPIKASEIVLPKRFLVRVRMAHISGSANNNIRMGLALWNGQADANHRSIALVQSPGNITFRLRDATAQTWGGEVTTTGGGLVQVNDGGCMHEFDVQTPDLDPWAINSLLARVKVDGEDSAAYAANVRSTEAGPSWTSFGGETFTRLALYLAGTAAHTITVEFDEIQVLKHPLDE